ncbi:reverse transcriptase/maturase family protein [Thermoflexibacter ruber]|uniref:Retron-type reverse transcriptase n=1 Tax=Thermoflexibacter ruber TaxID=1003 RepID=A0A1I2H0M8_9BACT|nr:reverse transcriptase/maturase family protein [Thermoflexibacter ruber]SFF22849.1 Retron-type reverse transcriptase [Thermoflexibacter ruber]
MQRIGNLYATFCSFDNLLLAYYKAKKGSRKNQESAAFAFHLEKELLSLKEALESHTYQPASYRHFQIHDPKERTISVATFRDRVVHHALVNVLEPIYEKCFIYDSYATRKGKGVHKAVLRSQAFLRKNRWFFKADIEKFFDSIDHEILIQILEKKIKDKKLIEVIKRIIGNGGKDGKGLPIGNLTSQFFANVYLHPFDLFVKETLKVKCYLRYMDDFVLFSPDKTHLKMWRNQIQSFLSTQLGLFLKENACFFNQQANGLSFLGRRVFPAMLRIRNENLRRVIKRLQNKETALQKGKITEAQFLESVNSYWAYLSYFGNYELRNSILQKAASRKALTE